MKSVFCGFLWSFHSLFHSTNVFWTFKLVLTSDHWIIQWISIDSKTKKSIETNRFQLQLDSNVPLLDRKMYPPKYSSGSYYSLKIRKLFSNAVKYLAIQANFRNKLSFFSICLIKRVHCAIELLTKLWPSKMSLTRCLNMLKVQSANFSILYWK